MRRSLPQFCVHFPTFLRPDGRVTHSNTKADPCGALYLLEATRRSVTTEASFSVSTEHLPERNRAAYVDFEHVTQNLRTCYFLRLDSVPHKLVRTCFSAWLGNRFASGASGRGARPARLPSALPCCCWFGVTVTLDSSTPTPANQVFGTLSEAYSVAGSQIPVHSLGDGTDKQQLSGRTRAQKKPTV